MTATGPRRRRRVVVQLAALVDLLFVVMFLQFTELQRSAAQAHANQRSADALKEGVLGDQNRLRRERDELRAGMEDLRAQLADATRGRTEAVETATAEVATIARAAKEALAGVDPNAVAAQVKGAPKDQRERVVAMLTEAKGKNTAAVLQALRKSVELKKRCDVWEVHAYGDGQVRVRGPDVTERTFSPRDANDFTNQFMAAVTEAGSPKDLVLIMFTHGNVEARPLAEVSKGLAQARTVWLGQLTGGHKSVQLAAPGYSEEAP